MNKLYLSLSQGFEFYEKFFMFDDFYFSSNLAYPFVVRFTNRIREESATKVRLRSGQVHNYFCFCDFEAAQASPTSRAVPTPTFSAISL
jgi:hypothetical protein